MLNYSTFTIGRVIQIHIEPAICDGATNCQRDQKKSHNVYKSCQKIRKRWILTPLQKMPTNVEDLGKLIFAKGFKKLPKAQ